MSARLRHRAIARPAGTAFVGLLLVTGLAVTTSVPSQAAFSSCTPSTTHHERWSVKTRATPPAPVAATPITVAQLIAITVPARADAPDSPIDDNGVEHTIYSLSAYVMYAKRSADDCDIHLEVADVPNPIASRVIVEIPPTLPDVQDAVVAYLGIGTLPFAGLSFHTHNAVRLHFLGFGFFDLSHAAEDDGKAGQGHGTYRSRVVHQRKVRAYNVKTILELHPAFAVGRIQ